MSVTERDVHSRAARSSRIIWAALALGIVVRLPFWVQALKTPLDADTSIVGLMARHPVHSASFWGQPYGSPLEAWLAVPFVAALGPTAAALRLFYLLMGLALIPLAALLGRALHEHATLPAAILAACPPAYILAFSALPPPLYPVTLVLCGLLLLLGLHLGENMARGSTPLGGLALWGCLAGLALWTHMMSGSIVAATAVYLFRRARGRRKALILAALAFMLGSAPLWSAILMQRPVLEVLQVSSSDTTPLQHFASLLRHLDRPLESVVGGSFPATPDDPSLIVHVPGWLEALLALLYGASFLLAMGFSRGNGPAGLLVTTALLAIFAFLIPLRSTPDTVRFLTPLYLPLAVLTVWVQASRGGRWRALVVAGTLALLHLEGAAGLFAAWKGLENASPPFGLPDLDPARRWLETLGIHRAYGSYETAYPLTYLTSETIIVSLPWNPRFPDEPLPYLDDVRFAKNVGWILTPAIPSDLPTPAQFENALREAGGGWRRVEAGGAVIYFDFTPPFGPTVERLPTAGLAGDGDLGTWLTPAAPGALTLSLPEPRSLGAVTLVAGTGGPGLPHGMDLATSRDGTVFEIVGGIGRWGRHHLNWVNGQPQYLVGGDLFSFPLGGRTVSTLRITPRRSREPWAIGEVLLHPSSPPDRRAWDEWLDPRLSWAERRHALVVDPRRDREDWYYRLLLSGRHS